MTHRVYCQTWEESERGWGTRPDGFSLHLNHEDLERFIADYWSRMPREVPDEYSRPVGRTTVVEVDEQTYKEINASKFGIWKS